eukprot:TRINITY_DN10738_c0_g1_i3.p1 TRINITY_DN10738_c0_g1~~TRINITY_DN10738_c0_g1_i3.p1  ORF type:complete len:620 (+),score=108.87 TRINITY_DN10738_c0_g1_i3:137-1996(+)
MLTHKACVFSFDPEYLQFAARDIPKELNAFAFMASVYRNRREIFISGGLSLFTKQISNQCNVYNPESGNLYRLPDMTIARFSHLNAIFKNRYYVLGGRTYGDDNVGLLKHVEYYDFAEKKWFVAPEMNKKRGNGFTLIYNDTLYVFGGFTAGKRSRIIEKLDEKVNDWVICDFMLPNGIEVGSLLSWPKDPSSFIIIGGLDMGGATAQVTLFNFEKQTGQKLPKLLEARVLNKGIVHKNKIFTFGGESSLTTECLDLDQEVLSWKEVPNYYDHITQENITQFCYSQPIVSIHSAQKSDQVEGTKVSNEPLTERTFFVFGCDADYFILRVDPAENKVTSLPIPLTIALRGFQGVCRVGNMYYLGGGLVSRGKMKISKGFYSYSPEEGIGQTLPKMKVPKYAFQLVQLDNSYIFAIGGRTHGTDDTAIVKDVQIYDIANGSWDEGPSLNQARCLQGACVMNNKIYTFGGFTAASVRSNTFEFFDHKVGKWTLLEQALTEGIEAPTLSPIPESNTFYILGGKTDAGVSSGVWKIEMKVNPEDEKEHVLAEPKIQMLRACCLHKTVRYFENIVIIFGGKNHSNFIQFYDVGEGKPMTLPLKMSIQEQIGKNIEDSEFTEYSVV